jgi:hypothetical protein
MNPRASALATAKKNEIQCTTKGHPGEPGEHSLMLNIGYIILQQQHYALTLFIIFDVHSYHEQKTIVTFDG